MSLDSDSLEPTESDEVAASNGGHAWGANGSGAAVAEAEAEAPVAAADESTAAAVGEGPADAAVADPAVADRAPAEPADDGSAFLAELTRAMQAAAGAERERAVADIERRREQHLADVDSRRLADADRIRTLAATDLAAIDAWAEGERTRIDGERETRAAALRDDLEQSLAEHGARMDREIAGVEAAIAAHRTEVDAFFSGFDHETDPVVIAQNAGRRPTFPALDSIAGEADAAVTASDGAVDTTVSDGASTTTSEADAARTDAASDEASAGTGVGVMNPAPRPSLADAWAAWSDPQEQKVSSEEDAAVEGTVAREVPEATAPETLDVFAVTSSSATSPTPNLIQSIPINRPLGWLRRGPGPDDTNNEA